MHKELYDRIIRGKDFLRRNFPKIAIPLAIPIVLVLTLLIVRLCCHPQLISKITLEAGQPLPSAQQWLKGEQNADIAYVDDISAVKNNVPGTYKIKLQCKNNAVADIFSESVVKTVTLIIADTVLPTAVTTDVVTPWNVPVDANAFIASITDATNVTVSFLSAPDYTREQQTVQLQLTDAAGNKTILGANLTVLMDREAPVIHGLKNIITYTGDAVSYRSSITVTDNMDAAPVLNVDNTAVDLSTPGVYDIIYTATDNAGNSVNHTITVTVYEKKENYVELSVIYEMVDGILEEIITPEMTVKQQVEAICKWMRKNCRYISTSKKNNWVQAAYVMMTEHKGDCYNYFGLAKLMLERLGIPNIDVTKVPNYVGDSNHFWHLVSIDGGNTYYHVDTSPRIGVTYFCLVTDQELDAFSAGYRNCFNRDKSLYPPTPTVSAGSLGIHYK